jgi:hypothetical protein
MTWKVEEASESTGVASAGLLRIAAAAYLACTRGTSQMHTASDLRIYIGRCDDHDLNPLEARRIDVELYARRPQKDTSVAPVHSVTSAVSGLWLLPCLRDRRTAGGLTRRSCPSAARATGITNVGMVAPAVRSAPDCEP